MVGTTVRLPGKLDGLGNIADLRKA